MKALLLGSIGVVCDTSDLQRQAYNTAFTEAGLDWHWNTSLYKKILEIPGGTKRLARYAKDVASNDVDVESIHKRKTELYAQMLEESQQPLRSGVIRLVKAAQSKGIKVGWITSTEFSNLEAILRRSAGQLSEADFDIITHRETVEKSKPHPAPYLSALKHLRIEACQAIAVEDTEACMHSAIGAGIPCVVTPHELSINQNFDEALSVVSGLGDTDSPEKMLGGISLFEQQGLVTIEALSSLHEDVFNA